MKYLITILCFMICSDSFGQVEASDDARKAKGIIVQAKEEYPKVRIVCSRTTRVSPDPLFVVDGCVAEKFEASKINPNSIQSVTILKGKNATDKYGEKAKHGVIVITTKPTPVSTIN